MPSWGAKPGSFPGAPQSSFISCCMKGALGAQSLAQNADASLQGELALHMIVRLFIMCYFQQARCKHAGTLQGWLQRERAKGVSVDQWWPAGASHRVRRGFIGRPGRPSAHELAARPQECGWYMQRWSETDAEWLDLYVFNEKNLSLQNDFDMMNYWVATCSTSMFQKVILAPSLPRHAAPSRGPPHTAHHLQAKHISVVRMIDEWPLQAIS